MRLPDATLADVGSWEWTPGQTETRWSNELYRIYGLAPGAYRPTFEGYLSHVHPNDRGRVRTEIERAVRERAPFTLEERIVRPDGSVRHLRTWGYPVLDERNQLMRLVGICLDITEQRQSYSILKGVIDGTPDCVFAKDLEGRYTLINPTGTDWLALDAAEVLGKTDADSSIPSPRAPSSARIRRCF